MNSEKTFKVTLSWIHDHKTAAGGWTKAQFEALGLTWSQKKKGWMRKVRGQKITDQQRQAFEDGRTIVADSTKKRLLKAELAIINNLPNKMK